MTYVTATAPGVPLFCAEFGTENKRLGPIIITADAPKVEGTRPQLPFVGQGWISLVLAIVLLIIVVLLALENVLSGEAVATILGAVAGYIFGATQAGSGKEDA